MRWCGRASAAAGALLLAMGAGATARAEQLVVVVTADWRASDGQLRRFERARPAAPWQPVGEPVAVVVGKGGLGWGAGLEPRPRGPGLDGPDKREGDGRAPAGRFALGGVTGYDEAPPAGSRLAYRQATPALRCVDDVAASASYNRVVAAPAGAPPSWASDEAMRRDDELYRLTVFVGHNPARTPGAGSCVFLHVWRRPGAPTIGCTAMALPALRTLVMWADSSAQLVQLPRPVYRRLAAAWSLPPPALLPPPAPLGDGQRK
jgi:hypothetical protein